MRVIPVIDLMGGEVVRGVAGRRSEYRPIESRLVAGSDPIDIAAALVRHFGFSFGYLADLDAIAGAEPAWQTYEAVAATGLRLMVDAGLHDRATAEKLRALIDAGALEAAVIGLETLSASEQLREFVDVLDPAHAVFSLDLKHGRPLTNVNKWRKLPAHTIAAAAVEAGVRRILLLDLARVGMSGGLGTEELAVQLRRDLPGLELIGGGGIRGPADLEGLNALGYNAVLVASALHDGRITTNHLQLNSASQ